MQDIAARTEPKGPAPVVFTLKTRGKGRMVSLGEALKMKLRTIGAAHKCVSPLFAMAKKMSLAVIYKMVKKEAEISSTLSKWNSSLCMQLDT